MCNISKNMQTPQRNIDQVSGLVIPSFTLVVQPVIKGETTDTVDTWMRNSRAWAGESGIHIYGLGADEDSKIRKYFHIRCHGAGNKEHGLSLEAPDFTFLAPLEKINNDHYIPELMFPDQLHMIKNGEISC